MSNQINNEVLNALLPLFRNLTRYILVVCDSSGIVLKFITRPRRYTQAIEHLQKNSIVSLFKREDIVTSIADLAKTGEPVTLKENFPFCDVTEPFYTSIPEAVVSFYAIDNGKFIALISTSEIGSPFLYNEHKNHILYLDEKGVIKGVNQRFFSIFKESHHQIGDILDKQINEFLSPTPIEIQKEYITRVDKTKQDKWNIIIEQNYNNGNAIPIITPSKHDHSSTMESGLVIENTDNEILHFPLQIKPFDVNTDFSLDIVIKGNATDDPLLCIYSGDISSPHNIAYQNGFDLSSRGYLIGRQYDNPHSMIKKTGFIAYSGDYVDIQDKDRKLSFTKENHLLSMSINDKNVIRWYDTDFILTENFRLSVAVRKRTKCTIGSIHLKTRKSSTEVQPISPIIRLKNQNHQTFLLNRFYTAPLNSSSLYNNIEAYVLVDISKIQGHIDQLTRNIKAKTQEEEKLRIRLKTIEERESTFVGSSPAAESVREKARIIANSNATVLIQGETGTGKEILAQFIHKNSPSRNGPFVKVDCSTLPRDLIESELFGHESGAFTGALRRKIGLIEQANRGTLFIDEISNLSTETQKKLLQFLQDFSIYRIGGQKKIKLDIRIIVASNMDLQKMVRDGTFREDLFHRLYVASIKLPPLRSRKEDLLLLANHFLRIMSSANSKDITSISPEALKILFSYNWPGNVRELKNVIQRAILFSQNSELSAKDIELLPADFSSAEKPIQITPNRTNLYHSLVNVPKEKIEELLSGNNGNVAETARQLSVTTRGLYLYFRKHGIEPSSFRLKI
ncbi:MAG: sigma-54-dependent Fis family transcriptional regulator [Fibrobacteres bacterium]|nr:sigma-54-dependent Fis family transcriptional regulator [Fibrobacterota bacterium]